jgi:type I restriction enzyme S subunit
MPTSKIKNTNTSALRFKGFEGVWTKQTLGAVTAKSMYGMNAAAIPYDGINKYLRITDIDDNSRTFNANSITSPNGEIEDKYKLKKGDIVFARTGASVGKTYLYNEKDGNLLFAGFLIKFGLVNVNSYFVFAQTRRSNYNKWVKKMSMRSGQPGINMEEYKELPIYTPSLPEQNKIGSFIQLIDERIATQIKIIEELQLLMVELSKKIFSRQIRFKEENGENFPEWQKKFFGDVYTFKVTNSFSRDNLTYENGAVRNIHYGDIHTKFSEHFDLNKEQVPFIKEEISLDSIKADAYCQEGDLVFADASEDLTDVGKCIEITNLHQEKTLAGLHTLLARPKLSIIHKGFGVYMMKSKTVRKQIMKLAQGSKVSSISSTVLSSISISIPYIKEQKKIGSLFSDISQKIDCEKRILQQYNIQKKYLLSNLFI